MTILQNGHDHMEESCDNTWDKNILINMIG